MQIKTDLRLVLKRSESSLRTDLTHTWLHRILLKSSSLTKIRPGVEVSRSRMNLLEEQTTAYFIASLSQSILSIPGPIHCWCWECCSITISETRCPFSFLKSPCSWLQDLGSFSHPCSANFWDSETSLGHSLVPSMGSALRRPVLLCVLLKSRWGGNGWSPQICVVAYSNLHPHVTLKDTLYPLPFH